jgi:predicted MPP superfamily phosphohydrolase
MASRSRKRILLRWLVVLLLIGLVLGVWAFGVEPASLRVREYTLRIPGWPAGRAGMRIALLADLHVGSPHNGLGKLEEVVASTNAARPDLVLILGDLVVQGVIGGQAVPPEEIAPVLGRLRAPLGVWAVLGNHDRWLDASQVTGALAKAGIPALEDGAVEISRGGPSFWLVGISDYWTAPHNIRKALSLVPDSHPALAFTHNPDIFPYVPVRVSLTLAGHTHGGQVYLPGIGRPVVPSQYGERYAIGRIVENGRHLFVTAGTGTSILPVRFLVPPEISIVRLEPLDPGETDQLSRAASARCATADTASPARRVRTARFSGWGKRPSTSTEANRTCQSG